MNNSDNTNLDNFVSEYEININEIISATTYDEKCENLKLYSCWEKMIAKNSTERIYRSENLKEYKKYDEILRHELLKYKSSEIINEYDKKREPFICFVRQDKELVLTKNNNIDNEHFIKVELDEYYFKQDYPELFTLKLYLIDAFDISKFLSYQIRVNFDNNIQAFESFYKTLKVHSKINNYLDIYEISEDLILMFLNGKRNLELHNNTIILKNEQDNKKPLSTKKNKLYCSHKLVFLKEIGFLKFIENQKENQTPKEVCEKLEKILIDHKISTITRTYSAIINNDTKNPYNTKTIKNFIETLQPLVQFNKKRLDLMNSYPNLPDKDFWTNLFIKK